MQRTKSLASGLRLPALRISVCFSASAVLTRWVIAAAGLAAIVAVYRPWLHVNPTTVTLPLLLLILSLAAQWASRMQSSPRLQPRFATTSSLCRHRAVDDFRSAELDRAACLSQHRLTSAIFAGTFPILRADRGSRLHEFRRCRSQNTAGIIQGRSEARLWETQA
jgi:hypothetical protein